MMLGLLWIVFSLGANIFHVFSLHLLGRHTVIQWIPSYADSGDRFGMCFCVRSIYSAGSLSAIF